MSNEQNGLNSLPPKIAFFLGLGAGVFGVCTLGFIILLWSMVGGGTISLGALARGAESQKANQIDQPAASAPAPNSAPVAEQTFSPPPPVTDRDHVRGDVNAKITLIEYSDLECPVCKTFHPVLLQLMDAYKTDVRWVYRHFPIRYHANAQKEAEASECAAELGGNEAFWKYIDAIFARTISNGFGFPLDNLVPLAKELGLNEQKFKECLDSDKYAQYVRDDLQGGVRAGVDGTPGNFLIAPDGSVLPIRGAVPFESLKQAIDSVL